MSDVLKSVIYNMPLGYAYQRILRNKIGEPEDYVFIQVNPEFENITGLDSCNIIGKRASKIFPINKEELDFIADCGYIAINGGSKEVTKYIKSLNRWYKVFVYSPERGFFITLFYNVSKEKQLLEDKENLITSLDDIVFELDSNYTFLNIWTADENLLYKSREDVLNKRVDNVFDGQLAKSLINALNQSATTGKKVNIEYEILLSGVRRWFKAKILSIKNSFKERRYIVNISDITERRRAEVNLQKRLDYEHLLNEISLLAVNSENVESFLNDCVRFIGETLIVSRIHIFKYHQKTDTMSNTVKWVAPDITAESESLQGIPANVAPWFTQMMKDNQIMKYENIEEIPDEGTKNILRPWKINSLLALPLFLNQTFFGFLGIGECEKYRAWPEEDINLLLSITRLIMQVLLRKLTENALKERECLLKESQKVAHIGSYVIDLKSKIWNGSPEINKIFGIDETYSHKLESWVGIIHPDSGTRFFDYHMGVKAEKKRFDYEYKIIRVQDGKKRWILQFGDLEFDNQGNAVRVIGTIQDITKRKEAEEEIIYLSYHDKLTSLYNRRFYEEEIKRLDTERNLPISIIMGDVNGLKFINDAFGHDKGDELLQKAAAAIKSACRTDDIVARWGGDEFVILLPKTNTEEAEEIVKRVKDFYSNEYVNAIRVSISFGWDTKKKADEDILKILKNSEDYMYRHKVLENEGMRGNTISTILSTLHEKNPREEQHSKRVSEICQNIGKAIGFSEIEISKLKVVGLLHDIGKVAIEEGILNKPGKLTAQEWDEIKRHPDIGYRILSSSYEMSEIADCILAHHERWDGKGYPKGLKGEAIPMVARIIAIADSYDAMTSERSYRKALSEEVALAEIRKNAGTQFDPDIARVFIEKVLAKQ